MMKILHLDFDDLKNPRGGGQAVRTFEINRRLAKRHQITVVTGNYRGAKNKTIEGIKYIRIGKGNFPWNILTFLANFPKVIKKIEHDILVENFTPPIGPAFTPLFTKKPVIAMVDWAFAWEMSWKYKLPFFIFQTLGTKLYKNFLFPTRAIKERLLGSRGERDAINVQILPDLPLATFKKEKGRPLADYLLFIGRLDIHQKGIDLLLKAYKKIYQEIKSPLYIAGEGKARKKILQIRRRLALNGKVILLGKISGRKKIKILSQARVICIPSRYEAGCIVASESLILKKAIVAFDIPVLRETTQNQAIYAKAFSVDDLAQKILYAYQNSRTISKEIKFQPLPSWEEIALKQERFYQSIVG